MNDYTGHKSLRVIFFNVLFPYMSTISAKIRYITMAYTRHTRTEGRSKETSSTVYNIRN